jgi:hypothetical protein
MIKSQEIELKKKERYSKFIILYDKKNKKVIDIKET